MTDWERTISGHNNLLFVVCDLLGVIVDVLLGMFLLLCVTCYLLCHCVLFLLFVV